MFSASCWRQALLECFGVVGCWDHTVLKEISRVSSLGILCSDFPLSPTYITLSVRIFHCSSLSSPSVFAWAISNSVKWTDIKLFKIFFIAIGRPGSISSVHIQLTETPLCILLSHVRARLFLGRAREEACYFWEYPQIRKHGWCTDLSFVLWSLKGEAVASGTRGFGTWEGADQAPGFIHNSRPTLDRPALQRWSRIRSPSSSWRLVTQAGMVEEAG